MKKKVQNIRLDDHRFGLFMSQDSFDLDIMYGRDFLLKDNVQEITLYRLNLIETKSHSLYGQSKPSDKSFMTPILLSAMVSVDDEKQELYGNSNGGIVRDDTGNLVIRIYLKELEEKNCEISRGDIISYNLSGTKNRFYEVSNANNVNDVSNKTIGGFLPYFKIITAVPSKEDFSILLQEVK